MVDNSHVEWLDYSLDSNAKQYREEIGRSGSPLGSLGHATRGGGFLRHGLQRGHGWRLEGDMSHRTLPPCSSGESSRPRRSSRGPRIVGRPRGLLRCPPSAPESQILDIEQGRISGSSQAPRSEDETEIRSIEGAGGEDHQGDPPDDAQAAISKENIRSSLPA